jgi:putative ABC transport system substrate-binding protein
MKPSARASRLAFGSAVLLSALLSACSGSNGGSSASERVLRVGLMHVGTDHVPPSLCALEARLSELGWREGATPLASQVLLEGKRVCEGSAQPSSDRNIELIWRNLEPEQATAQADAFVRERVDVIVAFEDQSIDAAREATTGYQPATSRTSDHIPVVFLHPSDPLQDGLAKSLSRPGGNLTGVFGPRDVVAKQLEVYQALVPRLRRVLTIVDPKDPRTERTLKDYQRAAVLLQRPLELDIREASTAEDLQRIFRSLRPGEVDGAFLLSNNLRQNYSALTIKLAQRARLPVQGNRKEWTEQGALFSYGIDLAPLGRAGARYVDSILRGTSPADLPVEEFPETEFAVNLETASRLGIKIPQEMIIRADEVYR